MLRWPIVALLFALLAAPAYGQDGARQAQAASEAAKTLQLRLAEIAAAKTPLEISKPPVAELFGQIFNKQALLALPPVAGQDIAWVVQWIGATSAAYQQLLMFGTDPNAPQEAVVLANLQRNEAEASLAMEFMLLLMPRTTNTAAAFFATLSEADRQNPARQAGLAQMRAGYMQTISGSLNFIAGDIKPENARLISAALRNTLNDWVKLTSPENRTELLKDLTQARNASKDAQVQGDLSAVSNALAAAK